jgi:light-regulated signal transduction histidine kinase (bacteriophytochrome)
MGSSNVAIENKLKLIGETQQAILDILENAEEDENLLGDMQKAVINILEDFTDDNTMLVNTQRAVLNILDDYSDEKKLAEDTQKAVINILEDYSIENARVEKMNIKLSVSNKELEQFAYIASHDLQEPLRTISNFVNLFQTKYNSALDADAAEFMDYISAATVRMQTLIKDLLIYSRIGKDESKTAIDCNSLLQEILSDMDQAIKESNTEIISVHLPEIYGSHLELKSLFQNLISNAIKYRKSDVAPVIHISAQPGNREWLFAIKDNGIGIDEMYFNKLFIIFQRLHNKDEYPGTGIGLAHCKKIVELHNGRIWLESEPEKGSTFYFTIPTTKSITA